MAPPGKERAVKKADGRKPQRRSLPIQSDHSATATLAIRLYVAPLISGLSGSARAHCADPAESIYALDHAIAEGLDSPWLAPLWSIFT